MKLWTFLTSLGIGAAFCALALTAQGAVQNTPHNMNYTFGANTIQDNQVCLPCHAPHNQPDKTQDMLWNHVMPTNGYILYAAAGTSIEGKSLVVGLDDTSLKCLSCHDGTVGVDSYGGYTTTAGNLIPAIHNATGGLKLGAGGDLLGNASTAAFVVGGGQDLSHDHPVGVLYPGLASGGASWSTASSFNDPTQWPLNSGKYYGWDASNNKTWLNYVDGTGASIKPVGGGFGFGTTGANASNVVGCGSCHTPHTYTYNFLVVPNVNSQLCLTCHSK